MFFVWSWWYIVIAVCLAGIVALAVVVMKMNKKDVELIDAFQKENEVEQPVEEQPKGKSTKKAE